MEIKEEPLDAGVDNVPITIRTNLDIYVGKVMESSDPNGNVVMCVVTEIDKVTIKQGKVSLDCKLQPLHLIREGETHEHGHAKATIQVKTDVTSQTKRTDSH